jgi:hypothetical protein
VTRRRGRRRKKLLDDLGDRRGYSYLKEEALDRIQWRNHFGRSCGPVVCLTDYWSWWFNLRQITSSLPGHNSFKKRPSATATVTTPQLFWSLRISLCHASLSRSVRLNEYYSCYEIKKNESGKACSTYRGEKRCMQGFRAETWGKVNTFKTQA